ncbi:Uncharacterised protein [Klebsiella pneumoniae]|uniref:hypothetical protein n=1 Tax=Klebsiella TaxID=570 RepID=UPI000A625724|nr:hypothetical protein [Klebsiella pneumoniae]MBW5573385.1 hypothetical protein [Klebsiella pneumoniae]MCQ0768846.1 hypothetical protein [Klebsiella pneumoniae]MDP1195912.1 hypothetical protein [Klebsiella pneumoniae]MDZ2236087.1 hypothetical protein [Klebsiella pneumoniae]RYI13772.1 hypothetical protein EVY38_24310 [Klebsiella pneumoniae]
MKNEIEQIAQQNDMSIEFVTWFFNEKKVGCGNVWFMMMAAMWEGWKGRSIEMDKLAAENVALKSAVDHTIEWIESTNGDPCDVVILKGIRTPATDRIVAGIKADGVEMVLDLIGHTKGMLYADSVKEMLSDVSSKLREGADK